VEAVEFTGNTRLIERFKRTAADAIDYQFTVDDPTLRHTAYAVDFHVTVRGSQYSCRDGNDALAGIPRGARVTERLVNESTSRK
jgi:hypothetical protein